MAIVEQKWNGSEVSFGDDGRAEIRSEYVIRGTTDEFVAEAALEAATLDAVGGLTKTRVAITGRLAEDAWEGAAFEFAIDQDDAKRCEVRGSGGAETFHQDEYFIAVRSSGVHQFTLRAVRLKEGGLMVLKSVLLEPK